MTITIKFNNNTVHNYNSIEEILKIDNYDDIIYIYCAYENLSSLPKLPNSIHELWCSNNNLSRLPELPNSLTKLCCSNNNIYRLPEFPKSLTYCWCDGNSLSSLPELPNSSILHYHNTPIYLHIENYFDGKTKNYFEYNMKMERVFVNKIENWFLDCKYNPKYLYCKKRLMKEYEELYG